MAWQACSKHSLIRICSGCSDWLVRSTADCRRAAAAPPKHEIQHMWPHSQHPHVGLTRVELGSVYHPKCTTIILEFTSIQLRRLEAQHCPSSLNHQRSEILPYARAARLIDGFENLHYARLRFKCFQLPSQGLRCWRVKHRHSPRQKTVMERWRSAVGIPWQFTWHTRERKYLLSTVLKFQIPRAGYHSRTRLTFLTERKLGNPPRWAPRGDEYIRAVYVRTRRTE